MDISTFVKKYGTHQPEALVKAWVGCILDNHNFDQRNGFVENVEEMLKNLTSALESVSLLEKDTRFLSDECVRRLNKINQLTQERDELRLMLKNK